ncbi:MAG: ATP-binding cassette domain-containing protein [Candidatus Anaerobiospirillum merdipullorum]|uniref:ATP-binding protein Uup n=1 Tax=Candidatus Anaerobiospirillum merdipullorum TaxID=2838450 RepID=A0A9E2KN95_9GAMM|nr:ATP-binding cassette domain-containing protein [Candidatus Anaerobiospirillum merdipullorum]
MALISILQGSLAYGDLPLLKDADFAVEAGERICLVGRNGTGKSSLLKVLCGDSTLDAGRLIMRQGLKVVRLDQDPPLSIHGTAYSMAAAAIPVVGEALAKVALGQDENGELAAFIEKHDGWRYDGIICKILNKMDIDPQMPLEQLSGGWRRKAALAAALACEPEVLLLDEPTNHLDIETIGWLEEWLLNFPGTLIFVTHDRAFADDLATRIVELDRGKLYSYPGNFAAYLRLRDERLRMEELANKEFDRVLAEEEAWIRRGVKARLARNEGRVRNLEDLRRQRRERRDRQGRPIMQISEADRSGNIVFELTDINVSFDGKTLIDNFSAAVMRQDRIGIVGPNGAGKTTLIKIMLGLAQQTHGKVRRGTNVQYQYFDQYHEKLNLQKSAADNVAEGRRDVIINGKTRHVISYLGDFLFTGRRARSPASVLSGGEKNRLLLARMFARPCNVLVMDEPTNDLDLETLELLEELIASFNGTVIVISHDRRFIDKVATETWVFDGKGHIETIVGGWSDVLAYYQRRDAAAREEKAQVKTTAAKVAPTTTNTVASPPARKAGISFTEQHELAALPEQIEKLEAQLATLDTQVADPELYATDPDGSKVKALMAKRAEVNALLEEKYARWEDLEERAHGAE